MVQYDSALYLSADRWREQSIDIHKESDLERLNATFSEMNPEERIRSFYQNTSLCRKKIILTSSFGTTAVYLLHLFYRQDIRQTVTFLDTGFHFKETLQYKNELKRRFDFTIHEVRPEEWKHQFAQRQRLWKSDPDLCCSVNKVEPMLKTKNAAAVWISGLMKWQSAHRRNLQIFQRQDGILKFNPILDVEEAEVQEYIDKWNLPVHHLRKSGYESIGCSHCTLKGKGRRGRWEGKPKTECGLHLSNP